MCYVRLDLEENDEFFSKFGKKRLFYKVSQQQKQQKKLLYNKTDNTKPDPNK